MFSCHIRITILHLPRHRHPEVNSIFRSRSCKKLLTAAGLTRPSSAGAAHRPEAYNSYKRSSTGRVTIPRHAMLNQYTLPTTPASPTRVYGTRFAARSAESLAQGAEYRSPPPSPVLTRSSTAPEMSGFAKRSDTREIKYAQFAHQRGSSADFRSVRQTQGLPIDSALNVRKSRSPTASNSLPLTGSRGVALRSATTGLTNDSPTKTISFEPEQQSDRGTAGTSWDANSDLLPGREHRRSPSGEPSDITAFSSRQLPRTDISPAEDKILANIPPIAIPSDNDLIITPAIDSSSFGRQNERAEAVLHERARAQTPVPSNYISQDKSKSLKNRLRRALSFSSSSSLSEMAAEVPRRGPVSNIQNGRSSSALYGHANRSMDDVSVSSTASSASVMLRKMTQGLTRKTKRSLGGIFSGSKSKTSDVSGVVSGRTSRTPSIGSISYVNAEADAANRPQSPRRAIFPNHNRTSSSVLNSQPDIPIAEKIEVTHAADNVDRHRSVAFPRLSEEITVEDDRTRRASMHLERPLPIDLEKTSSAQAIIPRYLARKAVAPTTATNVPRPLAMTTERYAPAGKGILKKSIDSLNPIQPTSVAHNALPSDSNVSDAKTLHGFDFSFEPAPVLQDFSMVTAELGSGVHGNLPMRRKSEPNSQSPALQFSPRITIHDTYTATEYDRRGEIATCNRLTPLLAQRIKEELNAYKMDEMSVAEESKVYTHFFA